MKDAIMKLLGREQPESRAEEDRELEEAQRRKQEIMERLINMGVEADVLKHRSEHRDR